MFASSMSRIFLSTHRNSFPYSSFTGRIASKRMLMAEDSIECFFVTSGRYQNDRCRKGRFYTYSDTNPSFSKISCSSLRIPARSLVCSSSSGIISSRDFSNVRTHCEYGWLRSSKAWYKSRQTDSEWAALRSLSFSHLPSQPRRRVVFLLFTWVIRNEEFWKPYSEKYKNVSLHAKIHFGMQTHILFLFVICFLIVRW